MYKEKIIDINSGEITWRDYTKIEVTEVEKAKKEAEEFTNLQNEKKAKRDSALAKLAALGLTEDEIAAL